MGTFQKGKIVSQRQDRKGFKLEDGVWYNSRNKLAENLNRDSEVEFQYTVNESNGRTYYNIVDGTFKITKEATFNRGGNGGGRSGGGGYQKKDNADYKAGVTAGVAINNACLLIAHGKADISSLPELARRIAGISKQLKVELKEGGEVSPAPQQPAPAPQSHVQLQQQGGFVDFDDDIPF
jgi:hypothetical protein